MRGLKGYEGHLQKLADNEESRRLRSAAAQLLVETRWAFEQSGIPVDIVITGGTGTHKVFADYSGVTELQVGSYLLMETIYKPFAPDFQLGLTVLSTVVSKQESDRLVIDAGVKAISSERGMPAIKDKEGVRLTALHAEHGIVQITGSSTTLNVGDKVELWVAYSDATLHLHRQMYGPRGETVEEVFKIEY